MCRLAIIVGLLAVACDDPVSFINEALAAQLQSCLVQTDVYTVQVHPGSATLNTATFNFDDLTGTITFKGSTPLRIFLNTNLNAINGFQTTSNPDQYFATFSATYHESLLAQTTTQACPLLTTDGGAYLQTH